MKTIINKNLKDLSVEELNKKKNDTKFFVFIVIMFGFIFFKGIWFFALIFLVLLWANLQEIQKELKSREGI
ncbi:MAG: hypothetical protein JNL70_16455 [Saprospiraceae bacterium]|nr:hypothetical protein [Saprospiraceae bacterium]